MARLLIPTRNRPTSLLSVIRYLERFHPETGVVIADGSSDEHAAQNAQNMASPERTIAVDYRRYPYEMDYFDRLIDVLQSLDDEFIIMGTDDDFPLMDNLLKAENLLQQDPEGAIALGASLDFRLNDATSLTARLNMPRPLKQPDGLKRARQFAQWPFWTHYAVTRRQGLIERYQRCKQEFLLGFIDFTVGVHDCFRGKVHAIPDFTYFTTRNFNHSYLRPGGPFHFLEHPDKVLTMIRNIAADIVQAGLHDEAEAASVAEHLLFRKVSHGGGGQPWKRIGFTTSNAFRNPVAQAGITNTENLLQEASGPLRDRYHARMRYVVDALIGVSQSSDNAGEAAVSRTLEEQMQTSQATPRTTGMFTVKESQTVPPIYEGADWPLDLQTLRLKDGFEVSGQI